MGGHQAGDMASRYAAEVIVSHIKRSRERNPIRVLRSAIETANERVLEKAAEDEELSGMGTTVVAATVVENYLYVANVGDSRLYLIRDHIRQITRDHSLVGEMVRAGELSPEQARNHPDKNIITRAVGAGQKLEIDFFDEDLRQGDILLMFRRTEQHGRRRGNSKNNQKTAESCRRSPMDLIERANRNGGKRQYRGCTGTAAEQVRWSNVERRHVYPGSIRDHRTRSVPAVWQMYIRQKTIS